MSIILEVGSVDITLQVQMVDDGGLPVTGLVAATFPAVKIAKNRIADVTVTLSDLASLTAAHSDGGVKERGEGYYRLDAPDSIAAVLSSDVAIRGEATAKRLICPPIQVVSAGHAARALSAIEEGTELTIVRGDTTELSITGLGLLTGYSKLWFTVKSKAGEVLDADAAILIEIAAGLTVVMGAAPEAAANGSITIIDGTNGDITVRIEAIETAKLDPQDNYVYDVQVMGAGTGTDDDILTPITGVLVVTEDVTKATS